MLRLLTEKKYLCRCLAQQWHMGQVKEQIPTAASFFTIEKKWFFLRLNFLLYLLDYFAQKFSSRSVHMPFFNIISYFNENVKFIRHMGDMVQNRPVLGFGKNRWHIAAQLSREKIAICRTDRKHRLSRSRAAGPPLSRRIQAIQCMQRNEATQFREITRPYRAARSSKKISYGGLPVGIRVQTCVVDPASQS